MAFFQFTTDKVVKRLCWVMVGTNLFDKLCTLLGQPVAYWHHPEAVREGNELARFFLIHGWPVYLLFELVYISAVFFVLSIIPRRLALVGLFAEIVGHYFAACTWLVYYWHFGVCASGIYGIILGMILFSWHCPHPTKQSPQRFYPMSQTPNTSLAPTDVGAGSSAARFTSRVRRGSVLGR